RTEDRGRMPDEVGGVELVAVALCGRDSCQHGDSFVRDQFLPRPWGRGRSCPCSPIARWAIVTVRLSPKGSPIADRAGTLSRSNSAGRLRRRRYHWPVKTGARLPTKA